MKELFQNIVCRTEISAMVRESRNVSPYWFSDWEKHYKADLVFSKSILTLLAAGLHGHFLRVTFTQLP